MGDELQEEKDGSWIFYRDRPEWKDVVPTPLPATPHPVIKIAYSDKFKDVFDYFRSILKSGEISERALELVSDAISLNTASYTAWHYRRTLLRQLGKDLQQELDYVSANIVENPKNYQVWHHRRIIVEWLDDASKEKKFTAHMLQDDPKNYHAWQHRQWFLETFSLWEGELEYIDELLEQDIRNNSAWNQRFFVIERTTGFVHDVVSREIEYCLKRIRIVVNNESAWNYLRGILRFTREGLVQSLVRGFFETSSSSCSNSPQCLAFLFDMKSELVTRERGDAARYLEKAVEVYELLKKIDPMRVNYWEMMQKRLEDLES